MEKYFGKYRGKVANNIDPMQLGRVQVTAPSILGDGRLSWAMPCAPYAGAQVGFFAIPPVNANIWVEFEGGNIDYPIWSGCFWGMGEFPLAAAPGANPMIKVLKTESMALILSDVPGAGEATLEVNPPGVSLPMKMTFNSAGIEIACDPANVKITPQSVQIELAPSAMKIAPDSLEIASAPSSVKLSGSGVEATNGPATLKMSGPKLDVNNGALEII